MGEYHSLGVTGGAAGRHHQSVAGVAATTVTEDPSTAVIGQIHIGSQPLQQALACHRRQAGIDRQHRICGLPNPEYGVHKFPGADGIDGDEFVHPPTLTPATRRWPGWHNSHRRWRRATIWR